VSDPLIGASPLAGEGWPPPSPDCPGDSPQGLLERLRAAGVERDAFLLGARSTLHAFLALGAIDRLELLEFPVLLGEGVPFSLPGTPQRSLELEEHHAFPDGTIRHVYTLK
jgi:dihydrofolate reductase